MQVARRVLMIAAVLATLASSLVFLPAASAAAPCTTYYTVQYGDNLFRISLRFNTSVERIMAMNGIYNRNLVYTGQSLCVVQSGPQIPPPIGRLYTVQYGDTLGMIARTFGVDVYALARLNNVYNINYIYAGQVLAIPDVTIQ